MKQWHQAVIQSLGLLTQILNIWLPIIPGRHKVYLSGAVGAITLVAGIAQAQFNRDGTSDKVAYIPEQK